MPGTASAARRALSDATDDDSDMFEIRLKCFDGDFQLCVRLRAPKLLGIEAHGIKPLRIFAFARGDGIGKDMSPMQALNPPRVAARVAWQACMRRWVNILGAHAVAYFEKCRRRRRPS